jgi:signal transduction histidine kinase
MTSQALSELEAWARVDERERVALDLHDGVAPLIEGARMHVEALAATGARDLEPVLRLLEECGAELRRTLHELCPPDLEALGLAGALERHVQRVGLACRVAISGRPRRMTPSRELAAFRLAQEALANASRHAGGGPAELRLAFDDPDGFSLEVVDAGPGTDVAGEGLGRRSMRRNARRAGGTFELRAGRGGGTTVTLRVPS